MRKHPLVTLSACGFLTIGGVAAILDSSSASGVLASRLSNAHNALHQGILLTSRAPIAQYVLDGYSIERARIGTDGDSAPRSPQTAQALLRHLSLILYREDVLRRAAAAHRAAQLRRERAQAAAEASADAAATAAAATAAAAAAAAAAQQAAQAAQTPAPPPAPAPKPKPQPKPVPKPVQPPKSNPGPAGGVWYQLRMCESNDNYATNTGNGYYGAYQFALSTWYGLGYTGLPSDAPPAVQDAAAQKLQAEAGWGQWPGCSAALGL